jgi:DNA polymerase-1
MQPKKLFLLDAMALIYRAYYAMIRAPRVTSKGLNCSAIFGFTNTLYELIRNENPTHLAVSFDTGAPTLRHAEFEAYKAHRESTPEDIVTAIPFIYNILEAFNIPILAKIGYEADDIIGTLAKKAETEDFQVYMMTSDKDYGQLVSENIFMYKPAKFGQAAEILGVKEICEKYSIENPEELIDILGLWGDASDNIPGVPNIGEVKAKKLIQQFHSIENIYKNINQVENDKLRQTLLDNQEQAFMSKSLATIMLDVPIDYDFETMKRRTPNFDALRGLFHELEFRSLGNRIIMEMQETTNNVGTTSGRTENKIQNTEGVLDLFNQDIESKIIMQQNASIYKTFLDIKHKFAETGHALSLPEHQSIFFEWIFSNDFISGFAFSETGKQIDYHIFESDACENHCAQTEILKTILKSPREIITFHAKNIFKYCNEYQIDIKSQVFDLQVSHYIIQPEISHQLQRITESYFKYQIIDI